MTNTEMIRGISKIMEEWNGDRKASHVGALLAIATILSRAEASESPAWIWAQGYASGQRDSSAVLFAHSIAAAGDQQQYEPPALTANPYVPAPQRTDGIDDTSLETGEGDAR